MSNNFKISGLCTGNIRRQSNIINLKGRVAFNFIILLSPVDLIHMYIYEKIFKDKNCLSNYEKHGEKSLIMSLDINLEIKVENQKQYKYEL